MCARATGESTTRCVALRSSSNRCRSIGTLGLAVEVNVSEVPLRFLGAAQSLEHEPVVRALDTELAVELH